MVYVRCRKGLFNVGRADDEDVGRVFDSLGFFANVVAVEVDVVTGLVAVQLVLFFLGTNEPRCCNNEESRTQLPL